MDTDELELKNAWREGYISFMNGDPYNMGPYNDEEMNEAWQDGWMESKDENQ